MNRSNFKTINVFKLLLMIMFAIVLLKPVKASAEEMNISVSGGTIEKGEQVSVTVSMSSAVDIGAFDISMSYDASVLEYVSCSSQCGGGSGSLRIVYSPMSKSYSFTITFKGLKEGSSAVSVSSINEVYDINENNLTGNTPSSTVTVKGKATPTKAPTPTATATPKPTMTQAPTNTATPTPKATESATVTPEPTATEEATPTPTNTPTPTVGVEVSVNKLKADADGKVTQVTEKLTVSEEITVNVPDGFELTGVTVQGVAVEALKLNDGNLILVQLSDDKLYVYDSVNKTFDEYKTIETVSRHFRIGMAPEAEIPAGYSLTSVKIGNVVYPAYCISEDDEFVLVYAEGSTWYKYDTVEGSLQRYDSSGEEIIVVTATPMPTSTPTPTIQPTGVTPVSTPASVPTDNEGGSNTFTIIKIVIMIIVFLLAIIFMILYVRERNRNNSYDDDGESFYEESEDEYDNPGFAFDGLDDSENADEFALIDDTEDYSYNYEDDEV